MDYQVSRLLPAYAWCANNGVVVDCTAIVVAETENIPPHTLVLIVAYDISSVRDSDHRISIHAILLTRLDSVDGVTTIVNGTRSKLECAGPIAKYKPVGFAA
jgi:hypothetical protein